MHVMCCMRCMLELVQVVALGYYNDLLWCIISYYIILYVIILYHIIW